MYPEPPKYNCGMGTHDYSNNVACYQVESLVDVGVPAVCARDPSKLSDVISRFGELMIMSQCLNNG